MYKIKRIKFINHDILGDLELNFCDRSGHAVDTVIIAGENGTGKSTILGTIFSMTNRTIQSQVEFEIEENGKSKVLRYEKKELGIYIFEGNEWVFMNSSKNKYNYSSIYSTVAINFSSRSISTIGSSTLDEKNQSRCSNENLSTEIKQLLVDIQAQDDSAGMQQVRTFHNQSLDDLIREGKIETKMSRFTNAFDKMFNDIKFKGVETKNGHKNIVFQKFDSDVDIDQLSSGEKQIVYKGCFLLKDANALKGSFVLIDEPEISMHPAWQMKIMDYYKGLFTDEDGVQTSQIFAVTHSPFIIHNKNRKNDKVLVLARDASGKIVVKDKPEYYECSSEVLIQDAFSISEFSQDKSRVYLEGRTDERYFKRALEVYGLDVPFEFKWIGYLDEKGQERNTGKDNLNKAVEFLKAQNLRKKMVCLYDSDCKKPDKEFNNVCIRTIKFRENNAAGIKKGIENILILDDIDVQPFRKSKSNDEYGCSKGEEFQKMKFCEYICSLSNEQLKKILMHVKAEIEELQKLFE